MNNQGLDNKIEKDSTIGTSIYLSVYPFFRFACTYLKIRTQIKQILNILLRL